MKTVDLVSGGTTIEHILSLAEHQTVLVRSADGKAYFVTEVSARETDDEDFAHEVALTRTNAALRDVLRQRSEEPPAFSLNEVRDKLGLS